MKLLETDKLFSKAESLRNRSQYKESLELFKKALSLYEAGHDESGVLDCRLSIGDVYRMTGDFIQAEKAYKAAVTTARKKSEIAAVADA